MDIEGDRDADGVIDTEAVTDAEADGVLVGVADGVGEGRTGTKPTQLLLCATTPVVQYINIKRTYTSLLDTYPEHRNWRRN